MKFFVVVASKYTVSLIFYFSLKSELQKKTSSGRIIVLIYKKVWKFVATFETLLACIQKLVTGQTVTIPCIGLFAKQFLFYGLKLFSMLLWVHERRHKNIQTHNSFYKRKPFSTIGLLSNSLPVCKAKGA